MNWHISDEQWETLTSARRTRPESVDGVQGFIATFGGLAAVATGLAFVMGGADSNLLPYCLACGAASFWFGRSMRREAAAWRVAFKPERASKNRLIVSILDGEARPTLSYQSIREQPDWEWLTIDAGQPLDVNISSKNGRRIGDFDFDRSLTFSGSDEARALLGPQLRKCAARWHREAGFIVEDDRAKVKLGVDGYDDRATLQAITGAFGAYVERLADPCTHLQAMAGDLDNPFDAARALAVLFKQWPDAAAAVCKSIETHPLGSVLAQVAADGTGLDAEALTWPMRSAIGRGVMMADMPIDNQLIPWLSIQRAHQPQQAMALYDLWHAADAVFPHPAGLYRGEYLAERAEALACVAERGGPGCIDWMQMRAKTDRKARTALKKLTARLKGQRGGLLSLRDAGDGALSLKRPRKSEE